ncbi:Expansin-A9 [Acorus calamus]|uniref:Expansin-A9 n=1 Tax=Acorus calamus TaxID=4465 RepID=A0AAV9CU38_ACOCL|nr:Expansin-A9 [Acorus calamus]
MPKDRRHPIHDKREGLFRARADNKRGRGGRHSECLDQRIKDTVGIHEQELGCELAEVQTSDGRTRTAYNVAPSNWKFGQTFSTTGSVTWVVARSGA